MLKTLLRFGPLCCVLSACSHLTVTTPPASCAKLIPETWKAGVEATPVPDAAPATGDRLADALQAVRDWASAYVGQSGQVEKANGRTIDSIGIFERCEALVNASRSR